MTGAAPLPLAAVTGGTGFLGRHVAEALARDIGEKNGWPDLPELIDFELAEEMRGMQLQAMQQGGGQQQGGGEQETHGVRAGPDGPRTRARRR